MVKELELKEEVKEDNTWLDMMQPKKNNEENPKSDTDNKSKIITDTTPKTESTLNNKSNTKNESTPKIKSNPKPNPKDNPINNSTSDSKYEKVKYTDTKTQRAFYYDNELIEIFDNEYPRSKYDKSQIMNDMLREFLIKNGKI